MIKLMPARLVFVVPALAVASSAGSWSGSLPWTIYGPGGCGSADASNALATGTTTSITRIAPEVLCETDVIDTPNGTSLVYTKLTPVECGSESSEFLLFDCEDDACASCSDTPEADGVVPNSMTKEAFDDASGCFAWYPKVTVSFGELSGNLTAQSFDSSTALADAQAYWSFFFVETCGESWWGENIIGEGVDEGALAPVGAPVSGGDEAPSASFAPGATVPCLVGIIGYLALVL